MSLAREDSGRLWGQTEMASISPRAKCSVLTFLRFGGSDPAIVDAPGFEWPDMSAAYDGVSFVNSTTGAIEISDGLSNTYLLREKHLNVERNSDGQAGEDNNPIYTGFDKDYHRWARKENDTCRVPLQAIVGVDSNNDEDFGRVHFEAMNMAFCDGSVREIGYSIDATVHGHLCSRNDSQVIDGSKF
jgi:prepilin-type processing-associated H-X9-DG protein